MLVVRDILLPTLYVCPSVCPMPVVPPIRYDNKMGTGACFLGSATAVQRTGAPELLGPRVVGSQKFF